MVEIGEACERWLAVRGFAGEAEDAEFDDEVQARLQQLSLLGGVAVGERAGKAVRRVQRLGGREVPLGPRCAGYAGYNLHANVSFIASDRRGLAHLCRYGLRPPVAVERVEKLAAIVPPPCAQTVVYAGGLAGNAGWRSSGPG